MGKIYIKYNPYTVKTEFKINNEPIRNDSTLAKQSTKRLQYWLEANNNNWNGIVKELSKITNSSNLDITFKGRKIDFEDLKLTCDKYKADYNINLIHIEAKNDFDIIKGIDEVFKVFEDGPIEELRSDDIKRAYEEVKSSKLKVNVIATMSSGKSTLINSIIGYELLPSKNEACTATIARITDNDNAEGFTAECKNAKEEIVYKRKSVSLKDIQVYNEDKKVTYIDIEGQIESISSEKINLLLVDTPGPNNSRNELHGELTESIIKDKKGIVLYVINATQFGINDDNELLANIANEMKRGGKQSKDRFVFAINKCDGFDCEKNESIENLLKNVKEYLKKHGIEEPNLFPVSAQMAKLIRMNKNGIELTRKERSILSEYKDFIDFEAYHFDKLASLSESSKINLHKKLDKANEDKDEYEQALIHTGIPAIEEAINEYLEKYAYPIKINDCVKDFSSIIEEKDMLTKIDKELSIDNKKYEQIRAQIKALKQKRDTGENAKLIRGKIDEFNIDRLLLNKVGKEIERMLNGMIRKFDDKTEIEKTEAERELIKLKSEFDKIEKDCKIKLNIEIENCVINEGEKLINEYEKYIYNLKEELNISGFKFENLREFKKANIENVEELMEKYSKSKDVYEEKTVKNYNKKWYKPSTWSDSRYYTVKEKVGEKTMINLKSVVDEYMAKITNETHANIKVAEIETQKQVENLKKYFNLELDKLDNIIDEIIEDLDNKTKDKEEIKKRVKNQENIKIWIEEVILKTNNIMDI